MFDLSLVATKLEGRGEGRGGEGGEGGRGGGRDDSRYVQ